MGLANPVDTMLSSCRFGGCFGARVSHSPQRHAQGRHQHSGSRIGSGYGVRSIVPLIEPLSVVAESVVRIGSKVIRTPWYGPAPSQVARTS